MTDLDFKRIDIEKLSKPPEKGGLYNIVKNNYWLIDKNGYGLEFKNYSYQRNINKNVCEKLIKSMFAIGTITYVYSIVSIMGLVLLYQLNSCFSLFHYLYLLNHL